MTALRALLDELHAAGAELVVLDGELCLIGDRSRVSEDLRARLRAQKPGLFEYLRPHQCARCGRFAFPVRGVVCFWCRAAPVGA